MRPRFNGLIAMVFLTALGCGSPDSGTEPVAASPGPLSAAGPPVVFLPTVQVAAARRPQAAASVGGGNGMGYGGGPVMGAGINAYLIWYGAFSTNTTSLVASWTQAIGGSPYFNVNTSYSDATGAFVLNRVTLKGTANDNYSRGRSLSGVGDISGIVQRAFDTNALPVDVNGVYFVLTSDDVSEGNFCNQYCGWHSWSRLNNTQIKVAFVGSPTRCASSCSANSAPNGDLQADAMVSLMAHELEETATDPLINAWGDGNGENADKCAWTFGTEYTTANGAHANMRLGGRDYLVQRNWLNAGGGSCQLGYAGGGSFKATFNGGDANAANPSEWDFGTWKGDCGGGAAVTGMSDLTNLSAAHSLLCSRQVGPFSGGAASILTLAGVDVRRAGRLGDWDVGFIKAECGVNDYVSGASMNPSTHAIHDVRCAVGDGLINGGQDHCETHFATRDDRGNTATGDWDPGFFKAECAAGKAVYGVSVSNGAPHKILCCDM